MLCGRCWRQCGEEREKERRDSANAEPHQIGQLESSTSMVAKSNIKGARTAPQRIAAEGKVLCVLQVTIQEICKREVRLAIII